MSTCDLIYHWLGSVIFFGGQMVMATGEDMIAGLVVKSTCVLIYHLLGSVISLVVGWPLRVGSIGGDHFIKVGLTVSQGSVIFSGLVRWPLRVG